MNGKYLLDTNVIIALFSKEAKIHKHLSIADKFLARATDLPRICKNEHFCLPAAAGSRTWRS